MGDLPDTAPTTFGKCPKPSPKPPSATFQSSSTSSPDPQEYSAQISVGVVFPIPGVSPRCSPCPGVSPRCPPTRSEGPGAPGAAVRAAAGSGPELLNIYSGCWRKWQRKRSGDHGREGPSGPEVGVTIWSPREPLPGGPGCCGRCPRSPERGTRVWWPQVTGEAGGGSGSARSSLQLLSAHRGLVWMRG